MSPATAPPARRGTRLMDRLAAWTSARGRRDAAFRAPPEPRLLGDPARGRALLAGELRRPGVPVQAVPGGALWDITAPPPPLLAELHGFGWLDDLAALGDRDARHAAQALTAAWIARHGGGGGPGWTAQLAGRRLMRFICHGLILTAGQAPDKTTALMRSLVHHANFVARRWQSAPPGLPRIEALTALLLAAVELDGLERFEEPARDGLRRACRAQIDETGATPSRNPETLQAMLRLLALASDALADADRRPEPALDQAVARGGACLRALRHADGALPRFHGAGVNPEPDALVRLLARVPLEPPRPDARAMGYARLQRGRVSVIADAAPPPMGPGSERAHASTLAFELTSHRWPVVVCCGPGAGFGADWERACRATAMQSTLAVDALSSARMAPARRGPPRLVDGPSSVGLEIERAPSFTALLMSHDGYAASHGLTHLRRLELSRDGRALSGEDTLIALSDADRRRCDAALARAGAGGIGHALRFHLHPQVRAAVDTRTVALRLPCGELWVFHHDGHARLTLEPSVYLCPDAPRPLAAQQIVLSATAAGYSSQMAWTLTKSDDSPIAPRADTR